MILATWNVNSISVRLEQVLAYLNEHKPDVLCIQETKIEDSKFPIEAIRAAGYDAVFHGQKSYNGVAIISNRQMDQVEKSFRETPVLDQARFIRANIGSTVVLNGYFPNGGYVGSDKFTYKMEWYAALKQYLDEKLTNTSDIVLLGDFNVAPDDRDVFNPQRVKGSIMCTDEERQAMNALKDWGLTDAFRMHCDEPGHFTWWDYQLAAFRRKMGFRIDHILISESLKSKCTRCWIDKAPRSNARPSDHTPVLIELAD